MKRSVEELAMAAVFASILALGMLFSAADAKAQEKGTTLEQQIQGSWMIVSMYNEQDGKKAEPFGPDPRGFMVLTPDGRFSMILMRASLPKFAANNRVKGTAEDNQAVVQGSVAYFGSYKVADEKEHMVRLHIDGCTFPNWDGEDQMRVMAVIGDEMKLTNPSAGIGGTNYVVLKRFK